MAERLRELLATASSKPWRRAPLLLLRQPGVLATVAGACAVMTAAIASVPLFLSSVGTESVALQAEERCPRDTGVSLRIAAASEHVRTDFADPFPSLHDLLGPTERRVQLTGLTLAGADPSSAVEASLLARGRALDHVEVLETSSGDGVWLPDRAAEQVGLGVGDTATLNGADVPVAGIYRDVSSVTLDDYWCSTPDLVLVRAEGDGLVRPPPMVLTDDETFARLMTEIDAGRASGVWEASLSRKVTIGDGRRLIDQLSCGTVEADQLQWCETGELPPVTRTRGAQRLPVYADDDDDFVTRFFSSHLPFVVDRSEAIRSSVAGGIWPVAGLAALAGVGLVAASASLWFDRRRRDLSQLAVRGVSPLGLGAKGVLELAIPTVAGVAAGVGLAYLLVVWLGPSSTLEGAAIGRAALGGALAWVLAVVTVSLVVAWRARTQHDHRHRKVPLGAIPWELLLVVLTWVSYQRLDDAGIPIHQGAEVSGSDPLGLLFPVLFIVTVVVLLSRILFLLLRPLRRASRSWPVALYLGIRRVARYRVAVLGLVAASAVAAGVLGYAATLNRSLEATLDAKGKTFVGSDVAARLVGDEAIPDALASRSTLVRLHKRAWIEDDGRESVTVIALDPETFERAAFWDPTFADPSLGEVLEALQARSPGGAVPGVLIGKEVGDTIEVVVSEGTQRPFQLAPLPGVEFFPGMRRAVPTVFVVEGALDHLGLSGGSVEAWIPGDPDQTVAALQAAGVAFVQDRKLADVADKAAFMSVTWTFGFMQSLALSAGLLVLGGVAVYLDARRRERVLANAFMERMGLTRAQHRRALGVELVASVVAGCWLGLATALVAAWLAHGLIDPVPRYRPDPVLRAAVGAGLALVLASAAVTVGGALLAQRRADRDDPVEVLRAGA